MTAATRLPVITGHGHTNSGARCFTVESRTDGHWYIVVVHADQLECQCKASQYRGRCAHRNAVHDRLVAEREAAKAAQTPATPAYENALPVAMNNNQPFSIWK